VSDRINLAGIAGLVATGLALGLGEVLAGLVDGVPSPISSVGAAVVDWAPPALEDFAIALFGTADKSALALGTVAFALSIGWFTGVVARRRVWVGIAAFSVFGFLGTLAGVADPFSEPALVVGSMLVASGSGLGALLALFAALRHDEQPTDGVPGDSGRRRFVALATAGGTLAVIAGGVGRGLVTRVPRAPVRTLEPPNVTVPPLRPANSFDTPGLSPVVTPNDRFYRIDTALVVPRVDPARWTMRIHGMVDREVHFTYDEILAMDLVEEYVTLACVSNEVGDDLVGNAKWTGVRLVELLDQAGVRPDATQIVGRSVDDWTAGFPTALAFDGREPLLAIGMNGDPLPLAHGFPARIVVPGLYGYVSATKWLSEIELTRWDDFDAYWIPRGWAKEGPIKMQSRIDVPRRRARIPAGPVDVAGVAWAPLDGISAVEIRVDAGEWMAAELTEPLSTKAWVQWRARPFLGAGERVLAVRVTDGSGAIQTEERRPPRPDGATGLHQITVVVT
jgi:DMSO/TMAO reductase YedYZ molybdopterin-dependent catalytic subunit